MKFMYGVCLSILLKLVYDFHFSTLLLTDKYCFFPLILQILREAGSSILEILKVDLVSFVRVPVLVSYLQPHKAVLYLSKIGTSLSSLFTPLGKILFLIF